MSDPDASEHLVTALSRLTRALRSNAHRWDDVGTDLRRSDLTVLRFLAQHGESRPGDIASGLCLNASVISRQLTSLEASGLLERRVDPADGRAGLVTLTPAGVEELRKVLQVYGAVIRDIVADWDEAKVESAAALLDELSHSLSLPPAPVPA